MFWNKLHECKKLCSQVEITTICIESYSENKANGSLTLDSINYTYQKDLIHLSEEKKLQ